MDIYLDIDGVLLTKDLKAANYAEQFVRHVVGEYPDSTYWLTTRCDGDSAKTLQYFKSAFSDDVIEIMRVIKPTRWVTSKTRAINFDRPFLWFDDNLFYEEKSMLSENNVLDNLIKVDLHKDPDQLRRYLDDFPIPVNDI